MPSTRFSGRRAVLALTALALLAAFMAPREAAGQERPIVVLDPGHGGSENGVVAGEMVEKDLVLRMAFTMAAEFVREGYDVRLTRTGDYEVPLAERRGLAEDSDAALLIMLHAIQSDDPTRHGAEIYFSEEAPAGEHASRIFAEAMEEEGIPVVLEPRDRSSLASPTVPTVMIETGFMTHPVERRLLRSEAYHRELARTFLRAIGRVLNGG